MIHSSSLSRHLISNNFSITSSENLYLITLAGTPPMHMVNIFCYDCSCSNYRTIPYCHSLKYNCICTNPNVVAYYWKYTYYISLIFMFLYILGEVETILTWCSGSPILTSYATEKSWKFKKRFNKFSFFWHIYPPELYSRISICVFVSNFIATIFLVFSF